MNRSVPTTGFPKEPGPEGPECGPIALPPLPYGEDALVPHIGAETLRFHYRVHHAAYVATTNRLLAGTELAAGPLEAVIRTTAADRTRQVLFNAAAQAWNHAFYWKSMTPDGGGAPGGDLAARVERDFGSYANFREQFSNAAANLFGSGWVWLVWNGSRLAIMQTHDADTPIVHELTPLLTLDVWEHAYYLDYQNRRADYIGAYLDKLMHWRFAAENLERAMRGRT